MNKIGSSLMSGWAKDCKWGEFRDWEGSACNTTIQFQSIQYGPVIVTHLIDLAFW
jgi:hypothetical protein